MENIKKISIITVVIIGVLLSVFVIIRSDLNSLFDKNENNQNIKEDEDKDNNNDNDNDNNPAPVNNVSTPVITLVGENSITTEVGGAYTDQGATAKDSIYGILTGSISITSDVDTNKIGVYTITYNVTNRAGRKANPVTRTVNVVDTTAPIITLDQTDDILVEASKNSIFVDPTVPTVSDNSGEIITPIITYTYYTDDINTATAVNKVDPNIIGNYIIHYNAVDSSSNVALEVTRKVIVNDTLAPTITFSREGTDGAERGAYLTVTVNDFSATINKYIFISQEMRPTDLDDDAMITLPENGIINPPTDGTYMLYVKSTDALGHETIKGSEGLFIKDIEASEIRSIVANGAELETVLEGTPYSYLGYQFTLHNFQDIDVVKIISKLYSDDTLLATNTVINDDMFSFNNPHSYINAFMISGENDSLPIIGETISNTATGYTLGLIPNKIILEVVTINNGIYTSTLTKNSLTTDEWKSALFLSIEDMTVSETVLGSGDTNLQLDVSVNTELQANTVTNIKVELYNNDELLAVNTANSEYLEYLNSLSDSEDLTGFTSSFYLDEDNTDPNFDTTLEVEGYNPNVIPDNVTITIDTTSGNSVISNIDLNLTTSQINNWNNALISG